MSYELTSLSFKQKGISSSEQQVLSLLAFRCNEDAICWPSVKSMHSDLKLDRKVILNCISSLIDKKLIIKTGQMKGKTKSVPVYKLTLSGTSLGTAKNLSSTSSHGSGTRIGIAKQYQNRDMEYKDLNVQRNRLANALSTKNQRQQADQPYDLVRSKYINEIRAAKMHNPNYVIPDYEEWKLKNKS